MAFFPNRAPASRNAQCGPFLKSKVTAVSCFIPCPAILPLFLPFALPDFISFKGSPLSLERRRHIFSIFSGTPARFTVTINGKNKTSHRVPEDRQKKTDEPLFWRKPNGLKRNLCCLYCNTFRICSQGKNFLICPKRNIRLPGIRMTILKKPVIIKPAYLIIIGISP